MSISRLTKQNKEQVGELKRAGVVSAFEKLLCCIAPQVHVVSNAWNI